ncbi:MAG: RNA polymerase sigma factor, partial [Phycisphaerales bacterium]
MFTLHRRTLWCIAAGVFSDRGAAEDVVQEAATVALTKLDQFDPTTSFAAWAGQIVRFTALNELRRRGRRRSDVTDSDVIETLHGSTAAGEPRPNVDIAGRLISDQDAFDDRVAHALAGIEETARCCLLLRVVRGLPYKEIAAILDVPEGTAMSHVHRARSQLR